MSIFIGWLILSAVIGVLGSSFGRNGFGWFLLALLLSPLLGLILLLIVGKHRNLIAQAAMAAVDNSRPKKTCPQCAEKILKEARICHYCGHDFAVEVRADERPQVEALLETAISRAVVQPRRGPNMGTVAICGVIIVVGAGLIWLVQFGYFGGAQQLADTIPTGGITTVAKPDTGSVIVAPAQASVQAPLPVRPNLRPGE